MTIITVVCCIKRSRDEYEHKRTSNSSVPSLMLVETFALTLTLSLNEFEVQNDALNRNRYILYKLLAINMYIQRSKEGTASPISFCICVIYAYMCLIIDFS